MATQIDGTATTLTRNKALLDWVRDSAALCQPDRIVWCDGSEAEKERLTKHAVDTGVLIPLNPAKRPGCYLHRSNPNDVARVEHLTFICTTTKEAAARPTTGWPRGGVREAHQALRRLDEGPDHVRDPLRHGAPRLAAAKVGIEITDSVYVVSTCGS
jgi:phosphoenolpyruvate carboxykinase (GTP)